MDLEKHSLAELKQIAEEKGVENISKLKRKADLINAIEELDSAKENVSEGGTDNLIENENVKEAKNKNQTEYTLTSDTDEYVEGILELLPDGYGFLRGDNYLSTNRDVYVSPIQIKRFRLDTGDKIKGIKRQAKEGEKFPALIYVGEVNGEHPEKAMRRKNFDDLTPIYPNKKLKLETYSKDYTMRFMDLLCPIGKGQRGMIVAPPQLY